MTQPEFIFSPGLWLGEGKITFSLSHEYIKFYTRWQIVRESPGVIRAVQVVEMQGVEEQMVNTFLFQNIQPHTFTVSLENRIVGKMTGTGLRQENTIAWEFRGQRAFEGFETYERQENGDYFFHAEYGSSDQFRSIIEGLVWNKEA